MKRWGLMVLLLAASAACANPPSRSLRPISRPAETTSSSGALPFVRSDAQVNSQTRPRVPSAFTRTTARAGTVCSNPNIEGTEIGNVAGSQAGCGVSDAVRVTAVNGVRLSQPATMNCRTARILNDWAGGGLQKAVGNTGRGVAELRVVAHYACRTRNSQRGAKISEHGKGNAIDIAAITLNNGDTISVLDDWGKGRKGRVLSKVHQSACGPFGTVLGPESDRFHQDHFHFDTAAYRSGSYCR